MAKLVQALARYAPKVDQGANVHLEDLTGWLALSSGLNANVTRMALAELGDAVAFYLRTGSPVHLPGIGRLRMTVGRDLGLRLHIVPDKELVKRVTRREGFSGRVRHADRAAWTDADYKAAWDAEFPDDPLELPRRVRGPVSKT